MSRGKRAATLPVAFFRQDAVTVARGLLGALIESRSAGSTTVGRIVEVEAYLGAVDPASHAYRFRRHRQNEAIYGPPGSWYVYRSYGMHWCANLVAGLPGQGAAVLLRAIEPLEGLETMRRRRGQRLDHLLGAGPGRLCQALAISLALNGVPMRGSTAVVRQSRPLRQDSIVATSRIGISRARDWPLRFVERGSRWLSRPVR